MTAAESVKLIAVLSSKDIQMLEVDNSTDIFTVINDRLDSRLNKLLNTPVDFTTGRTYRARSKDLVSSENTYLSYQNSSAETYTQYKTTDGLILNVLEWFDTYDQKNYLKVMVYDVKATNRLL
jgi:hypothetical protein